MSRGSAKRAGAEDLPSSSKYLERQPFRSVAKVWRDSRVNVANSSTSDRPRDARLTAVDAASHERFMG
jgi:hypothetical protein